MAVTYEIEETQGLVTVTAVGGTGDEEWKTLISRVLADPAYRMEMKVLIDVSEFDTLVSTEFIWNLAREAKTPASKNPRWAIVVSRSVNRAMVRLLRTVLTGEGIDAHVVRTREEAEFWLGIGEEGQPRRDSEQ